VVAGVSGDRLEHSCRTPQPRSRVEISDDLLDVTGTRGLGKIGRDGALGRATFVSVFGVEGRRRCVTSSSMSPRERSPLGPRTHCCRELSDHVRHRTAYRRASPGIARSSSGAATCASAANLRPGVRAAAWLAMFARWARWSWPPGRSARLAQPVLVVSLFAGYAADRLILTGLAAGLGIWASGAARPRRRPVTSLARSRPLPVSPPHRRRERPLTGSAARPAELLPASRRALFAVAVAVAVRRALLDRLAYWRRSSDAKRSAWLAPAVVALGRCRAGLGRALTRPPGRRGVPAATCQVAVVAVDRLSREELEAARGVPGGSRLGDVAAWGWAPLEDLGGRLPAVVWATVACGVEPARHGVVELEEIRLFGAHRGVPLPRLARTLLLAWRPFGGRGGGAAGPRPARAGVLGDGLARRMPGHRRRVVGAGRCDDFGEVASERTWLAGDASKTRPPPPAAAVRGVGPGDGAPRPPTAWHWPRRPVAGRDAPVALSFPALDLEQRGRAAPPLLRLAALPAHLEALSAVRHRAGQGYAVCSSGAWHGGAVRGGGAAPPGRQDRSERACWPRPDQLGLPVPARPPAPLVVRVTRDAVAAAGYGPPRCRSRQRPEALAAARGAAQPGLQVGEADRWPRGPDRGREDVSRMR
jgi:hypothetical protein